MTMTMDRCLRYSEKLLRLLRPFGSLHMVTPLSLTLRYLSAQAVEAKPCCELARETPGVLRPKRGRAPRRRARAAPRASVDRAASLVHVAIAHDPARTKMM